MSAILGPVQIIFSLTLHYFKVCPHRPASWAGSRAGSPVSYFLSLAMIQNIGVAVKPKFQPQKTERVDKNVGNRKNGEAELCHFKLHYWLSSASVCEITNYNTTKQALTTESFYNGTAVVSRVFIGRNRTWTRQLACRRASQGAKLRVLKTLNTKY